MYLWEYINLISSSRLTVAYVIYIRLIPILAAVKRKKYFLKRNVIRIENKEMQIFQKQQNRFYATSKAYTKAATVLE